MTFGWAALWATDRVADYPHADPEDFRMQTRDLYIAPGDIGFWQAAIRESGDPDYPGLRTCIEDAEPFTIELLYGDHEGGQRTDHPFRDDPRGSRRRDEVVPVRGAALEFGSARSPVGCTAGMGPADQGRRPRSKASQRRSYQTS